METNVIYNEECIEGMSERIPDDSIDMILADLPYGTTACKWDSIIPLEPLWEQYKRITKDGTAIVLTGSQPFTTKLIQSNMDWFKYEWIWDKHIPRGFQVAKYRPMNRHENVVVFTNDGGRPRVYNPQKVKRDKPVTVKNYSSSDKDSSNQVKYNDGEKRTYTHRHPDTIIEGCWEANADKKHPTQKPVSLFKYLIKTYTNKDDIVLDNVIGGGTTAIACKALDRKYIGFEQDKKYYEIAQERVSEVQKELI